nr:GILT-like protein 1 isoform X1 [Leptinotarsa decemlineata]XP_023026770.1 GILT-like protein 1 isoform X2 [Leptinotarsa decemlineata]
MNFQAIGDVEITIYYSTLSPQVAEFFNVQVRKLYNNLAPYFSLELVPNGMCDLKISLYPPSFGLECPRGKKELRVSEVHSCAVNLYSEKVSLEFVLCSMGSDPSNDEDFKKCAESVGMSWKELKTCFEDVYGILYQGVSYLKTKGNNPFITSDPTVFFNGYFNRTLQYDAITNLQGLVCEFLNNEPDACKE